MARLPNPGGDEGTWGNLLNDFLSQAHNADGSLKSVNASKVSGLAPVAISNSYNDLASKPTIPTTAADVGAVPTTGLDAATAALVGNGSSTTAGALRTALVPFWEPAETVTTGTVRMAPDGMTIKRTADGTTRASYDATEQAAWTVVGGGTALTPGNAAGDILVWDGDSYEPSTPTPVTANDIGAIRRLQFVSAYQSVPTAFATNQAAGITFRHTHKLVVDATDVRLVVPLGANITNSQTATEVLAPAALPFKGSVELHGAIRPVLFSGGVRSRSCDPGGILLSDPMAVDLPTGTAVPVRTFFNVTTGQPYPNTVGTGQGPGFTTTDDGFTAGSDRSDVMTAMTAQATTGFVPHGLVGVPATPVPAIAGLGDSITLGTGDATNNGGYLAYATDATYPLLRLAVGGATAQGWAAGHSYTWPLLDYCTHAIVMLGANDGMNSRTQAQFQGDLTSIYTMLRKRGLKVYACTILPRTTSTDSWTTTANQTAASSFFAAGGASPRGVTNAWIRGGASGQIDGFFETADAVESARNSGLWKPNNTADGAHPTTAAHQAIAANIDLSALTT